MSAKRGEMKLNFFIFLLKAGAVIAPVYFAGHFLLERRQRLAEERAKREGAEPPPPRKAWFTF